MIWVCSIAKNRPGCSQSSLLAERTKKEKEKNPHTHTHTSTYICIHTWWSLCVFMCMYVCMYTHIYMYTYTNIHTVGYTHTVQQLHPCVFVSIKCFLLWTRERMSDSSPGLLWTTRRKQGIKEADLPVDKIKPVIVPQQFDPHSVSGP